MGVEKEVTVGLKENFEKVRKLIVEDSKHDPEDTPYASKYAAKSILNTMKCTITKIIECESDEFSVLRYGSMLGAVLLNIGIVSIDTEELSEGEKNLMKCLTILEGKENNPETVIIVLSTLNQLGILWSHREDPQQSKVFLDKAEALYKSFKGMNREPIDICDLFKGPDDEQSKEASVNFEKTHTLSLYYLAQIYGSLEDYLKSAVYCHITLKRQLEYKDYEPIDWALNCATLSQFFMEKNGFKQCRHHLAAASVILDKYEEELMREEDGNEIHDAKMEVFKHRSADVARCWVKYGLLLLTTSKDRLMQRADDAEDNAVCSLSLDLAKLQLPEDSSVSVSDLSDLYFPSLGLMAYEKDICDEFILTFDDAREVFRNIQIWLDKAKKYYTMESHASDCVQIIHDASQSFKVLAFFEDDEDRQAKMHKRRVDLLEEIVKDLNPLYYLQLCRQSWYELAETYSDILDIKLDKLRKTDERPNPHVLKKINNLCEQSIKHFNSFLSSIKEPVSQNMPMKFPPDLVKPSLIAYFHIGRLYMKMIALDKNKQLANIEETLKAYSKLVEYCDKDKEAAKMLSAELSVCREMVVLLPIKIQRLREELQIPSQ